MPKKTKTKAASADANLHIRLPAEEKAFFMKVAEDSKFDFTTWVRLALRKASGFDKR